MANSATAAAPAHETTTLAVSAVRIDHIDVLRGLSILAVVVHHIYLRIPLSKTWLAGVLPKWVINDIAWNGYNGVVIFFAISGFLITTTCLRRWKDLSGISLRGFYQLRLARIAPCLVALLVVLSALHLLGVQNYTIDPERASLPRALVAATTLHVNWLEAQRGYLPANWDVLWSLSNEEAFYLFFPIICVFLKSRKAIAAVLGAFVIAGPFARTVFTSNELWADYGYLSAMDAISIGCLAAMIANRVSPGRRTMLAMRIVGIGLVVFITIFRAQVRVIGLYQTGLNVTVLALGTALIMIAALHRPAMGSKWTAPLRWMGRNSYEIYLTHMMPVFAVLPLVARYDAGWRFAPAWYAIIVALGALLGAAVARWYSEPMNRMLRAPTQQLQQGSGLGGA